MKHVRNFENFKEKKLHIVQKDDLERQKNFFRHKYSDFSLG